jgi:hypothetical protein
VGPGAVLDAVILANWPLGVIQINCDAVSRTNQIHILQLLVKSRFFYYISGSN